MRALVVEFNVVAMPAVDDSVDASRLSRLADFVLRAEKQEGGWEVALVLTTDPHLRTLHRDYMGIDSDTDVMTFPAEPAPGEDTRGGDIVVSVDRAREQAPSYGHTAEQEIEFLAVHGLLHLCGWVDEQPDARAKMLQRQSDLLGAFNRAAIDRGARDE